MVFKDISMHVFQSHYNLLKIIGRSIVSMTTAFLLSFSFTVSIHAGLAPDLDTMIPPDHKAITATVSVTKRYALPLGAIRKVNGVIRAEKSLQLQGRLQRSTWELAPDYATDDVHQEIVQQLKKNGAKLLFTCQGRACGSSNQWANNILKQAILYGIDREQVYAALISKIGTKTHYYAIYASRRGNRKIYLHVDVISESGVSPEIEQTNDLSEQVLIQPFHSHQLEQIQWSNNLAQLRIWLANSTVNQLYLVGQSRRGSHLDQQLENSEKLVQQVAQALQEMDINLPIKILSIGPFGLSTSYEQKHGRVLIMLGNTTTQMQQ
jgi:ferredoxin